MSEAATRPVPGRDATVSLREITQATLGPILELKVAPEQEQFVANNAVSIAQAHFSDQAWFRAIYADDTPVGFVMLHDDPGTPEYFLWRLMIGAEYQGQGFGKRAVERLLDYVRTRPGAKELLVSYVPGDGCPEPFYRTLGFEPTGQETGGEVVLRLPL